MARRHRTLRQRAPQIDRLGLAVALAQQFGFEQIEKPELFALTERGMIGDIVGGPDEIVERENQRPVTRMDDPRRDRKVLVAVSLAGSQFARAGHQELATFAGNSGFARRRHCPRMRTGSRTPYRGIRCQNQCCLRFPGKSPTASELGRITGLQRRHRRKRALLLAVVFQHLIAGLGQFGTVLLKARQNGEIALIDHRTAEALNVARTGLLLLRRAAALLAAAMAPVETDSDNRMSARKNLRIVFLHSDGREFQPRIAHGMTGTDYSDCRRRGPQQRSRPEALVNAAKFAAARMRIADACESIQ